MRPLLLFWKWLPFQAATATADCNVWEESDGVGMGSAATEVPTPTAAACVVGVVASVAVVAVVAAMMQGEPFSEERRTIWTGAVYFRRHCLWVVVVAVGTVLKATTAVGSGGIVKFIVGSFFFVVLLFDSFLWTYYPHQMIQSRYKP